MTQRVQEDRRQFALTNLGKGIIVTENLKNLRSSPFISGEFTFSLMLRIE
jgi:hypothetical protein